MIEQGFNKTAGAEISDVPGPAWAQSPGLGWA